MALFLFNGITELESTYQGNSNENMTFGLAFTYTSDANLNVAIQHGGRNTLGINNADFLPIMLEVLTMLVLQQHLHPGQFKRELLQTREQID